MTFEEFDALMYEWHNDVQFHSSHEGMKRNRCFDIITKFAGQSEEDRRKMITFTCLLLRNPYVHLCFILLSELVDDEKKPPAVPEYYAGRIPVIRECWRYWALKENIVKSTYDIHSHSYRVEDENGNKGKWH